MLAFTLIPGHLGNVGLDESRLAIGGKDVGNLASIPADREAFKSAFSRLLPGIRPLQSQQGPTPAPD